LVGNPHLISYFQKLIDEDRLSHGYLFFGRKGIGKFAFARSLSHVFEDNRPLDQALEAEGPSFLVDATIIDQPSVGIDDIRAVKRFVAIKPIVSRRRTVIINNADFLTVEAQQAMLKITEDALASSLFILVSSRPDMLMPTVLSRFMRVYFRRPPADEIERWLQDRFGVDRKLAREAIELSLGSPYGALELVQNPVALKERRIRADTLGRLNLADAYEEISSLNGEADMEKFFESFLLFRARRPMEEPESYIAAMKELSKRMWAVNALNTNKRLQMEALANTVASVKS